MSTPDQHQNLEQLVHHATDALGSQVELQIALARAELSRDAATLGRDLAPLAIAAPVALMGYTLLCAAAATLLARWVGLPAGLALTGVLQIILGGLAARSGVARLNVRGTGGANVR